MEFSFTAVIVGILNLIAAIFIGYLGFIEFLKIRLREEMQLNAGEVVGYTKVKSMDTGWNIYNVIQFKAMNGEFKFFLDSAPLFQKPIGSNVDLYITLDTNDRIFKKQNYYLFGIILSFVSLALVYIYLRFVFNPYALLAGAALLFILVIFLKKTNFEWSTTVTDEADRRSSLLYEHVYKSINELPGIPIGEPKFKKNFQIGFWLFGIVVMSLVVMFYLKLKYF